MPAVSVEPAVAVPVIVGIPVFVGPTPVPVTTEVAFEVATPILLPSPANALMVFAIRLCGRSYTKPSTAFG